MGKKYKAFIVIASIFIVAYNSDCAILGIVSDEQTTAIKTIVEKLKVEDYVGAEATVNSINDSKWNYYQKNRGEVHDVPYIGVPKDKILGTISLQKELLESLRKQCTVNPETVSKNSTDHTEEINALNTNIKCLTEGANELGRTNLLEDQKHKDLFVNIYLRGKTSFMDSPIGQRLPLPINESMRLAIKNEINNLATKRDMLNGQQKAEDKEKQETKECKAIKAAFHICDIIYTISVSQEEINHQKKIGAVSGYVDKQALYQAGRTIVSGRQLLAEEKDEYKKLTGKKFNTALCPKYLEAGGNQDNELYKKRLEACGKNHFF